MLAELARGGVVGPDSGPQIQDGTRPVPTFRCSSAHRRQHCAGFGAAASRLYGRKHCECGIELDGPLVSFRSVAAARASPARLQTLQRRCRVRWRSVADAKGIRANIDRHGAAIQAAITSGRRSFQSADIRADRDAAGSGANALSGQIRGPLEDALGFGRALTSSSEPVRSGRGGDISLAASRHRTRASDSGRERVVQARFVTSRSGHRCRPSPAFLRSVDAVSGSSRR